MAARHGDLELLEWLMAERDTETTVKKAVEEAANFGHLHILEWLYSNHKDRTFSGSSTLWPAIIMRLCSGCTSTQLCLGRGGSLMVSQSSATWTCSDG